MDFRLTDQQVERQGEFRQFGADYVADYADTFDRQEAISPEVVTALRRHSYLGAHLPKKHGGLGLDMISYGLLHFEIGKLCSSVRSLLTVHDMVSEVLLRIGSPQQRDMWLPVLASGEQIGAFALTEPHAGSDASSISSTAIERGHGYSLSGHKKWISFGQIADVFLILAHVGQGGPIGAFLVNRDTPGLTITPMHGLLGTRAAMLAELDLDGCEIPANSKVGVADLTSGLATAVGLNLGRYTVAWGAVGIGQAALDASLVYSGEREQYGVAIGQHQLIQRLLTNMVTDLSAARLLCFEAGFLNEQGDPDAVQATLMAKYFASQTASRVANDAIQIHGALGLTDRLTVERLFRDARVMEIIEGSNEIQQIMIAGRSAPHQTDTIDGRDPDCLPVS